MIVFLLSLPPTRKHRFFALDFGGAECSFNAGINLIGVVMVKGSCIWEEVEGHWTSMSFTSSGGDNDRFIGAVFGLSKGFLSFDFICVFLESLEFVFSLSSLAVSSETVFADSDLTSLLILLITGPRELKSGFGGSLDAGQGFSNGGEVANLTDLAGAVADLLGRLVSTPSPKEVSLSLKGEVVIIRRRGTDREGYQRFNECSIYSN